MPEGRRLLSELTVEDNLRVATYSLPRADAARAGRDRALELFPELGKRLDATGRTLSGGEQQMLVLAQAMVSQPRFILIDELSLGLAPRDRAAARADHPRASPSPASACC